LFNEYNRRQSTISGMAGSKLKLKRLPNDAAVLLPYFEPHAQFWDDCALPHVHVYSNFAGVLRCSSHAATRAKRNSG
jgi:hypothetical protein